MRIFHRTLKEWVHPTLDNTNNGNIHRRFLGEYWWWAWYAKRAFTRLITLMRKIRS